MKDFAKQIFIGVSILIIGGILIAILLSNPSPVPVAQHMESACQARIEFDTEGKEDFEIGVLNTGNPGNIFTSVSSKEVLIKTKEIGDEFKNKNVKKWVLKEDASQDFNFILNKTNNSEEISLKIRIGCANYLCLLNSFCCNYNTSDALFELYDLESTEC